MSPTPPAEKPTRRSFWGQGITLFYGLFVAAVVGFVIWSLPHRMDLVTDDYYEQELAYGDRIEAIRRAKADGAIPETTFSADSLEIRFPEAMRGWPVQGRLVLYRPSDAKLDRSLALPSPVPETWQPETPPLAKGLWQAHFHWVHDGHSYYHEQTLSAP